MLNRQRLDECICVKYKNLQMLGLTSTNSNWNKETSACHYDSMASWSRHRQQPNLKGQEMPRWKPSRLQTDQKLPSRFLLWQRCRNLATTCRDEGDNNILHSPNRRLPLHRVGVWARSNCGNRRGRSMKLPAVRPISPRLLLAWGLGLLGQNFTISP